MQMFLNYSSKVFQNIFERLHKKSSNTKQTVFLTTSVSLSAKFFWENALEFSLLYSYKMFRNVFMSTFFHEFPEYIRVYP